MQVVDNANEQMVRLLLDNGAHITKPALKLARDKSKLKLLQSRLILQQLEDLRYKQFKVIRQWSMSENLHSPSSNQMFYDMGSQLGVSQTFEEFKQEVPDATRQNYHKGC